MPATQGFNSDHPVLTHSAAARESTNEDAAPSHHDKKYYEQMALIFEHGGVGKSTCTTSPVSAIVAPYAHVEQNEAPSGHVKSSHAHLEELQLGRASPVLPEIPHELADQPVTKIHAGLVEKPFHITTHLLIQKSPFFAALTDPGVVTSPQLMRLQPNSVDSQDIEGPFFFPELDEFAFALFVRWIYGGTLHGPKDFHSMNHYVCLYVLGQQFAIEQLRNTVMDLIRSYYHREDMTAPPFRLEYIYKNTTQPCPMREFLITTAAFRALSKNDKYGGLSDSMKGVLSRDGDIAPDFVNALVSFARGERADARTGDPCRWHEHYLTPKCPKWAGLEPFEDTTI